MPDRLSPAHLDEILALQLTIAWAGEAAGDPSRLGWWRTDLVDAEGGGDLFVRLVPRTAQWTSLMLVREAARRCDEAARKNLARGDSVWTLFHFGFAGAEQLADRLAHHRRERHVAADVLGARFLCANPWSESTLRQMLEALGKAKVEGTPGGRHLHVTGASPVEAAGLLAAALLPLEKSYPLAFIEVGA